MTVLLALALVVAVAIYFSTQKRKGPVSHERDASPFRTGQIDITDTGSEGIDEPPLTAQQNLYKAKALLSPNEKEFFIRLAQALPGHHVLSQVALGALLQPDVKNDNKLFYRVRGTFAQKIADYVICNKDLDVVAIIELDDRTHRDDKDAKRDAMLEQAGYKVIRWQSKSKPSLEEIQARCIGA